MTSASIAEAQQRLELGSFVELFTLDVSSLGGGIIYWTPSRAKDGEPIVWQGNTYTTVDVQTEGFERSASGTLPTPRLTVGNADNLVSALLSLYGDILGCTITRTRTLYEFMDGQPGADPNAQWPLDIFKVERKISENKNTVVLELSAAIDQEGTKLPRQVMLRDVCTQIYRRWNGTAFDYTNATCPYVGAPCFNKLGASTTASNDQCGLRVSDCKLRFGATAELPFQGFPALARTRTR